MLCVHALQAAPRDEATKVAIARLQARAGSTGGETPDGFAGWLRERREDVTGGGSDSGESACAEPPIARQRTREGACESEWRDVVQQTRTAGLVGHSDGEASGEESDTPRASDGEASGEESGDDMVDGSGALSDTPRASDGEASGEESDENDASTAGSQQQQQAQQQQAQQQQAQQQQAQQQQAQWQQAQQQQAQQQ